MELVSRDKGHCLMTMYRVSTVELITMARVLTTVRVF